MGGSPLASSSSRPSKTASHSTAGGGRFEYASDRSPLQKLELELKVISNEESEDPKAGIRRTLSKHQAERLQRSATVTSRLTTDRTHDSSNHDPNRRSGLYEAMGAGGKQYVVPSRSGKDRKYRTGFFSYFHRHRGPRSNSSSDSSDCDAPNGTPRGKQEPVARLTIEDTELVEHVTDEFLTEDPEPDYSAPHQDEGMPFTLLETLSSGLIILPQTPDIPFFSMVRNPLLQQPRIPHPYRPEGDLGSQDSKLRRLSTATAASFSSPNLLDKGVDCEPKETLPFHSTSTLMQYQHTIPSRPVPEPSIFTPKLYVKCGPLLRYAGLRQDRSDPKTSKRETSITREEREVWRGTVMIVTADNRSSYDPPPRLRLFVQSIEQVNGGRVQESGRRVSMSNLWRKQDGEKQRKYRDVIGTRLLSERGVTWWRFSIETELTDKASSKIRPEKRDRRGYKELKKEKRKKSEKAVLTFPEASAHCISNKPWSIDGFLGTCSYRDNEHDVP